MDYRHKLILICMLFVILISGCDFKSNEPYDSINNEEYKTTLINDTVIISMRDENISASELGLFVADENVSHSNISGSYDNITVSFIDVGQGDSILIKDGEAEMLIDCGDNSAGQTVVDFLNTAKVSELEYLVITHTDADHIGGCDDVLKAFAVNHVIMDGQKRTTKVYTDVMSLISDDQLSIAKEGDKGFLENTEWEILQGNTNSDDSNQNSIVIRMDFHNTSFLFTGDCDRDCEQSLLNKNIDVDILKVAHHCSQYGTTKSFLDKVTPHIAVIQVGENNRFGHPTEECLSRLEAGNIEIHRNDLEGNFEITAEILSK